MKPSSIQIGLLGGGQLGKMTLQAAADLDLCFSVLDPDPQAPCASICTQFSVGHFNDYNQVLNFGKDKDIVSIEIEHVHTQALRDLVQMGVKVYPQPEVIEMIQDKGLQKTFFDQHQIPTADFHLLAQAEDLYQYIHFLPAALKLRKGGYDGKGVMLVMSENDIPAAIQAFKGQPCVLEKWVACEKELAVITARNESGEEATYHPVEAVFNPALNLVERLVSPARLSPALAEEAIHLAKKIAQSLGIIGVLAVEYFWDGVKLYVNELAPRPHNSGHSTIETHETSQFQQFIRAIVNLPLGSTQQIRAGVMLNILGEPGFIGPVVYQGLSTLLKEPGAYVHLYGKKQTKPFRKMGHITITADTLIGAEEKAQKIAHILQVISE